MTPLSLLFEADGLPAFDLPDGLRVRYGGLLGFPRRRILANFVESLDGVVALEQRGDSGAVLSGHSEADRFVMGLLRAVSDAVLIGAGNLRAAPQLLWTPDFVYPPASADYAELRRRLGRAAQPRLVIVTASGELPPARALEEGALVVTTQAGASLLGARLPAASTVVGLGDSGGELTPAAVIDLVRAEGHDDVLCEGGPHLFGALVAAGLVDELFLTLSPLLAGRAADTHRLGLVEGAALSPEQARPSALLSARRHGDHLFLRYGIGRERVACELPVRARE